MHGDSCPTGAHVHRVGPTLLAVPNGAYVVVGIPGHLVATDQTVAERIAALIETHGLCDVPDTVPAPAWPAPDPHTCHHPAPAPKDLP